MKQIILRFGLLAFAVALLLQLSQYSMATRQFANEWMIALFGMLFLGLGFLLSRVIKSRSPVTEPPLHSPTLPSNGTIDRDKIEELGISKREYEVLELIAQGCSNQEIAKQLFISESTVKTHVSKLLQKLDARRRTQAVKAAKELHII